MSTFDATEHPRSHATGRFVEREHSDPEAQLPLEDPAADEHEAFLDAFYAQNPPPTPEEMDEYFSRPEPVAVGGDINLLDETTWPDEGPF